MESILSRHWVIGSARTWQRALIISGVILFSAVATHGISLVTAAAVALPIGVGAIYLFMRQPYLGPLALILVGLLANIGTSDNFNPTVLLLAFLTGVWVFDMVVRKRWPDSLRSRSVNSLLMLMLVAVLAFIVGQWPWFPIPGVPLQAQLGGLGVYILSASAALMVVAYIHDVRWLRAMVWLLIVVGSLYVAGLVLPRPFRAVIELFPWGSTSCLFSLWLIAHLFSQSLLNRRLNVVMRIALAIILVVALYELIVQTYDWKSGWIPPLVAVVAIVGLRWPRLLLFMGVCAICATPFVLTQLIAGDAYSYSTRVAAWRIMLEIIAISPLIGLGPSNYYSYSSLYAIDGYHVNFNSHNQYIDLVAQTGILGLTVYLWFFLSVAFVGWRLRRYVPEGFAKAYVYGALGALCGMFVAGFLGDWVLPFVYNVGLVGMRSSILGWLFLGGLLALDRMYVPRNSEDPAGGQGQFVEQKEYDGLMPSYSAIELSG